mgnify:CR=1 FL=1
MKKDNFFMMSRLLFWLLMLLPVALVINKYFGKGYVYTLFLAGGVLAIYWNFKNILYRDDVETFIKLSVLVFLVALTGFFQQDPQLTRFPRVIADYANALLPIAIFAILHAYGKLKFKHIINTLALASVIAGLIAFYDFYTGVNRYYRVHGSPIIYGDLSMLFGLLTIVLSFYYNRSKKMIFYVLAGGLGIWASFFSGSRGGWIALIGLTLLMLVVLPSRCKFKVISGILVFLILLGFVTWFFDGVVKQRVVSAYDEFGLLFSQENYTGGSLGSRVEFWRISLLAFLSSPIWGIGVGEFFAFKAHLIEMGEVPKHLMSFKHAHNEYFSILSGMGIVGVLVYLVLFIWVWRLFKQAYQSSIQDHRFIGLAGMATIICYVDFSLTESFLSSPLGGAAFFFLMSIFIYFLNQRID